MSRVSGGLTEKTNGRSSWSTWLPVSAICPPSSGKQWRRKRDPKLPFSGSCKGGSQCRGRMVEPKPSIDVPGLDTFEGEVIHTARWNPDVNLRGKEVTVVGTGCSAAQAIPQIMKPEYGAKRVTVAPITVAIQSRYQYPSSSLALPTAGRETLCRNLCSVASEVQPIEGAVTAGTIGELYGRWR